MNKIQFIAFLSLIVVACADSKSKVEISERDNQLFDKAHANAIAANEGFIRCENFVEGWLEHCDAESGLIPRNLEGDTDIWNAKDAAADNYPFMVLTSFFVDQRLFDGKMLDMLRTEKQLTSRVHSLPDTYSFFKKDFQNEELNMGSIIFGTSEYIKDGLLPLTEWLGESPWSERMIEMLYDLKSEVNVADQIDRAGSGNATREEVNGELLQTLSRIYWMTGDTAFLDWAIKIGDYYLLGDHHPTRDLEYLRLRDHGCELISGLCELYVVTSFIRSDKKEAYQAPLHKMLDRILEVGRNEDGFFYDAINPQTGQIVQERIADNWGYTLNGYYAIALLDDKPEYKEAISTVFSNLHKYENHDWENGSSDGYADAIESALNLFNRMPEAEVADWIDSEIKVMWGKQQDSGIIEGWHGDGNFARTSIMFNLWKSKGVYAKPWREDLLLGAEQKGDSLLISITAEKPWTGKLYFDTPRHKANLKLPIDWPRINQFPEWFTVSKDRKYEVVDFDNPEPITYRGNQLSEGLTLEIGKEKKLVIH
tara:strand:+ start:12651 stop:14264 length:1614 start_codon:yes stop_codon:yes gene_type:complete